MNRSVIALVGAAVVLVAAGASNTTRSRNKAGAVLVIANQRYVNGTLTGGDLRLGREAGHVSFNEQLIGQATTQNCLLTLTSHGADMDDGWTVKATAKTGKQPCSGIVNGVYLDF